MSARTDALVSRLRKGAARAGRALASLSVDEWERVLYEGPPPWTVRDMVGHLLSAEDGLRRVAQDIASGGSGAPSGLHHDDLNAAEQARLAGVQGHQLARDLAASRKETVRWVATLSDRDLDRAGLHPALGEITVETHLQAMYGHGLTHLRDLARLLREDKG